MSDKSMSNYVEVNGQLLPAQGRHISALDRGFALSDGVFETIRVAGGRAFRLEAHLARLRTSAAALWLPVPPRDEDLAAAIERVLAANGLSEAVVRLTVSRGVPSERGLLPPTQPAPTVVVQASPFHDLPQAKLAGFSVVTSGIRRNESSPTARIKACNYLDNVLARMEAQRAGADEAILLNTAGNLACCGAANLHLVAAGRVATPATACGALPGITRQVVQELCARLGVGWQEDTLHPDDLLASEEVFLTNSVVGIVPITRVDGRAVGEGKPGAIALRLRRAYLDLVVDETQR